MACVAMVTLMAGGVQAQTITNPSWTRPPDPDLSGLLLPAFANTIGVSGSAVIECHLFKDGHPFLCRVISEPVPGLGFGAAARLVVASGELSTRRVDGEPTRGSIRTRVSFSAAPLGQRGKTWTGPEPTPEGLRLARQVVEMMPEEHFPTLDDMMDGLDYDRRAVVRSWIEELDLGPSPKRVRDIRAIQFARLFNEDELRGLLDGRYPEMPTEDELLDACPELTAKEAAGLAELRSRYCARYQCGE